MAQPKLDLTNPGVAAWEMAKAALLLPVTGFDQPECAMHMEGLLDTRGGYNPQFSTMALSRAGVEVIIEMSFWRHEPEGMYAEGDVTITPVVGQVADRANMMSFTVRLEGDAYTATHNLGRRIEPDHQMAAAGRDPNQHD